MATESQAFQPISVRVYRDLLRTFGRSPRIVEFFGMYTELRDVFRARDEERDPHSPKPEYDFFNRMRVAVQQVDSRIKLEATRNRLFEKLKELRPLLRRIDSGQDLPDSLWRRVIALYADMLQAVGADRGIYTSLRRLPGSGPVRWLRLQHASPREQAVEELRREDPDLYERTQQSRAQRRQLNERIRERIQGDGLEPDVRMLMNRPMNVGISSATGEMSVYDQDGEVLTVDEFYDKIREKRDAQDALLSKVNPAQGMWDENLDFLRKYSEEELERAPGVVRQVALTDDPDKASALTRIYPVKDIDGRPVVVTGRFRGIPLADMVNAAGRQIEGSSYMLERKRGPARIVRRELKGSGGQVLVRPNSEPYVTVEGDKFYLRMPRWNMYRQYKERLRGWRDKKPDPTTGRRERHKGLVDLVPSIEYVDGSGSMEYRFEAQDFAAINDAIDGIALSNAAARKLQEYYDELTRAEQAANAKNLERYNNESLGLVDRPDRQIRTHVKKSLAWLDANGNRGICALDTGLGKTLVAISAMLNLRNQGKTGRFLYVCEDKLEGNLPKETYKFLSRDAAKELLDTVDIVNYRRFVKNRREDETYADDYEAIYFDEAHLKMAKKSWVAYRVAVGVQCEHKVLLTASPMAQSPREVLTMASVANSLDLNSREGRDLESRFVRRFAQSVGGRIVGITDDPATSRDFRVWVKRNLFFEDKRNVEDPGAALVVTGLGESGRDLVKETVALTMPPSIEDAYRQTMADLLEVLREWEKFEDFEGDIPLAIEVSRNRLEVKRLLKRLTLLSDTPDQVVPGAPNLKLDQAAVLVRENLGSRTLLFTDSEALAQQTFDRLREELPGQGFVLGLSKYILYAPPVGEVQRFGKRTGRNSYVDPKSGRRIDPNEWASHVLNKVLGLGKKTFPDKPVCAAVLTGGYAVGQNLQSFSSVIHLDRDSWNSETMNQRTARAWRSGNSAPVSEVTLDLVYPDTEDLETQDRTLDDIRRIIQKIDARLFDQVVLDSQSEKLGEEWLSIKQQRSALHVVDRRMIQRALSPYAAQLGAEEA